MSEGSGTADVFELLSHPDRLSILRTLVEVSRSGGDRTVRFTDLRDRSAIDDNGRFNYHLGRLVGVLVTRTNGRYRLSDFGHRVLAPMVAGAYDDDARPDEIESPGRCYRCGNRLSVVAESNVLRVVCEEGHVTNHGLLGYPNVIDASPEAALEALALLNRHGIELAVNGVCPICHGHVEGSVAESEAADAYLFEAPCASCGNQYAISIGGRVLADRETARFLHEHGRDPRRTPTWAFPFARLRAERLVSEDPFRVAVEIVEDADRLAVVVDRSGDVVSRERDP